MEEINIENKEQLEVSNSQIAEASFENVGENFETTSSLNLGKFKNVNELKKAYETLQSEFTRKCQALSEFEKQQTNKQLDNGTSLNEIVNMKTANNLPAIESESINFESESINLENEINIIANENLQNNANNEVSNVEDVLPSYLSDEWDEKVSKFFMSVPKAKDYAYEIASEISRDKVLANLPNSLELAYNKVLASHYKSEDDYFNDEQFLEKLIHNDKISQKIIRNYIENIQKNKAPIIMSTSVGSGLGLTPKVNPKNLSEAKLIAERMFKKD